MYFRETYRYPNGKEGFNVSLPVGPCGPVRHAGAILSTSCAAGQSRKSSYNSVPRKRFRQNQMYFATCFVPQKRFKSHQMDLSGRFVPRKRFIQDKTALQRRGNRGCEAYTGDI